MYLDSHCHLDADEFDDDRDLVIARALKAQVSQIIVPAVKVSNFQDVKACVSSFEGGYFALGIHPLYVRDASIDDLQVLDVELERLINSKHDLLSQKLIAVGEIGLDFFVPELCTDEMRDRQEYFFVEQLKIAKKHGLSVILHVRKSVDRILKFLRQVGGLSGVAHAFNGSEQQASAFVELGFCLGFGGSLTFERALQIRRLASNVPLDNILLETDAPDISPSWIYKQRNEPAEIPKIASVLADLRGITISELAHATTRNAARVFKCQQLLSAQR